MFGYVTSSVLGTRLTTPFHGALKLLLGRRFGLQNGLKLPRFFMFGTKKLYISRPNGWRYRRLGPRQR
jgi:hypothetical protein